ncbi:hypothetical protein E3O42_14915 [Cryobacterium adonitolivorans]|uniref:DUF559 domain-containing protein n=1 Tax=Cryobacterium adonitolivorans TaxID=1259189 RepID=A0A4R8VZD3_9MICO|nr:hypothetical protein [Cryobacterium adonitolivorans]TFB98786.1 hypothetical protein E3O42_14915 [Cryobacterium adonitolivorans]
MTARIPLPDGWADRPFRVGDAIRAGLGTSRLDGADLDRPFWGIRTPESSARGKAYVSRTEVEALCRALLVRMPRGAFFSHATAALLLGLPVPSRLVRLRPLHVGVLAPARAMDARDIVGHGLRLAPDDLVERGVLVLTGPARTWLDLAAVLTLAELVAIGDYLLYWESPIVTRGELSAALEGYSGRRGLQRARAVLPLLRTRSESPRESMLRVIIVLAGLPEPECNHSVFDANGTFLARGDLVYPGYRLFIEYQGDHHRTDRAQWRADIRRIGRLEDHGWRVLQFTDDDLQDPTALVARIRLRLRARG